MSLLFETIKVKDGILYNLDYHSERLNRSRKELFDNTLKIDLHKEINIPNHAKKELFKCRIEYDQDIRNIEFTPYTIKKIETLRLVNANTLAYSHKYINRTILNKLFALRDGCDDVLFVINGFITDTSFSNIVLKDNKGQWYTPKTYLLPGTKRKYLIDNNIIKESKITPESLSLCIELRLINSMLDIEDTDGIKVENIR